MKRISVFSIGIAATVIAVSGFLSVSGWKETERSRGVEDEVERLREEAERIRGENGNLAERIDFFSTESFEEREAKEKLGMRRSDEEAVALDTGPFPGGAVAGVSVSGNGRQAVSDRPNYRKWLIAFGFIALTEEKDKQ